MNLNESMGRTVALPGGGIVVVATKGVDMDTFGIMITGFGGGATRVGDGTNFTAIWMGEFGVGGVAPDGFSIWVGVREVV